MSNDNPTAHNYAGPYDTEEPSREASRADSDRSPTRSQSKDQTPHKGRLPKQSDGDVDNTCGLHDHVLIAKQSSRTRVYHLPAPDNPAKPACHHGTEDGRGKTGSWLPIDCDSRRLDDKTLCQWCDPDVEVDSGMPDETTAGQLSDLDADEVDLLTDGGVTASNRSGGVASDDSEETELPAPFHVTASGPAEEFQESDSGTIERHEVSVSIEREIRDPADLVFFIEQADKSDWKANAINRLLDADSCPAYDIDGYDEWSVTFDGPVDAWFAVVRQMLNGEFARPQRIDFEQPHAFDVYDKLSRDATRDDAAYWVMKLVQPLVNTPSHVDLYGDGPEFAYTASRRTIDGCDEGDV